MTQYQREWVEIPRHALLKRNTEVNVDTFIVPPSPHQTFSREWAVFCGVLVIWNFPILWGLTEVSLEKVIIALKATEHILHRKVHVNVFRHHMCVCVFLNYFVPGMMRDIVWTMSGSNLLSILCFLTRTVGSVVQARILNPVLVLFSAFPCRQPEPACM